MTQTTHTPARRLDLLLLAVICAGFLLHAAFYWTWLEDDAFITWRYASHLVEGEGLVFNPGERVEGYSNFGWVMISAAAIRAGIDPALACRLLGVICGCLALPFSWLLARRLAPDGSRATLIAPLLLAVSPVLVRHTTTGLETAFFALFTIIAVWLADRMRAPVAGPGAAALLVLLLLAIAVVRPEGPAVALAIALSLCHDAGGMTSLLDPRRWRRLGRNVLVTFVCLFAIYYLWRWSYFGDAVTNTCRVKMTGDPSSFVDGIQYLVDFLRDNGGALLVGMPLVLILRKGSPTRFLLPLAIVAGYTIFTVLAGGDWMYHYRFFAHVMPLLAALVSAGVGVLSEAFPRGDWRRRALPAVLAVVLATTFLSMGNRELAVAREVVPAIRSGGFLVYSFRDLGIWLEKNTAENDVVAVSDIGAVGYFSGRVILDMFGLVDRHISGLPGKLHHKADPDYVLRRRPDWVVLIRSEEAATDFIRYPDQALFRHPDFARRYDLVREQYMEGEAATILVYRRRN